MRTWRDDARDHARAILTAMLDAVRPSVVLRERVRFDDGTLRIQGVARSVDLRSYQKVRLLAVGKAAGGMAAAAQRWGPFAEAVCIAPYDAGIPEFECLVADHPEPSARSVAAGERALELARATREGELLLVLLSGGASALAEVSTVPLEDLRRTSKLLMDAGADIHALNTVRRHLSRLKGGGLLRAVGGGQILLFAISDVRGDDLAAIGSGPASADPTTFADARAVLENHGLTEAVPRSVQEHLARAEGETVKPGDALLSRVVGAAVVARNEDALHAGARAARTLGYDVHVRPEALRGEARERGRDLAQIARRSPGWPTAILLGGESTVHVVGSGRGGRNQEVALAAVDGLSSLDAVLACLGTDGVDGPTDAAGAIVDGTTRARAEALGLDAEAHLAENDAYPYFDALHDLVRTGPTGTNVRDVALLLVRGGGS